MNATELADELENTYPFVGVMEIAATMLRQQQERLTKYELRHAEQRKRIDELEHQQKAEIEALKNPIMQAIALAFDPVKELTEILATIKCLSDEVSPYKEYENTYSDGWLDACNTVYDEVFAILRKAQEQ